MNFPNSYGRVQQVSFQNARDFYEAIGYFSNPEHPIKIVWENNDKQGAWGKEGRIEFYCPPPPLSGYFKHTAGRGNTLLSRVNCNEYVHALVNEFGFSFGVQNDPRVIRALVPPQYFPDFDRGYWM